MRIGITTYGCDADGRVTLPSEYVACVRAAGGQVVLLPPGEPDPARWLADLDVRNRDGDYLFSANRYICVGRRGADRHS